MIKAWGVVLGVVLTAGCSSGGGKSKGGSEASASDTTGGSGGSGGNGGSGGGAGDGASTASSGGSGQGGSAGSGGTGGDSGGSAGTGGSGGGSGGSDGGGGSAGAAGAGPANPDPDGPLTIATDQQAPTGIAVNETHVYFANREAGTIVRCPRAGCGDDAPEVIVSGQDAPIAIAMDATELFWVTGWNEGESGSPPTRPVFHCPLEACDPDAISEFERGSANPYGLELTADTLYLASWPQLLACPREGCNGDEASSLTGPAVDSSIVDDTLYAALFGWGEVQSCVLPDCESPSTVMVDVWPIGVAVDDSFVYVTDNADAINSVFQGEARVVRCPRGDCSADTLSVVASGDVSPYGIALYGARLYFSNVAHGTVVSLRKPE